MPAELKLTGGPELERALRGSIAGRLEALAKPPAGRGRLDGEWLGPTTGAGEPSTPSGAKRRRGRSLILARRPFGHDSVHVDSFSASRFLRRSRNFTPPATATI
jgi:hypothetical protein